MRSANPQKEMSFFEHLEELRWHIFRSAIALLITSVIAFLMKDFVFGTFIFGPTKSDFITFRLMCKISDFLCFPDFNYPVANMLVMGKFLAHLKISFLLGFIISFPYLLYQIWTFVQPALYSSEKRLALLVMVPSTILFFTGAAFGYFLLIPFVLIFMKGYELGGIVDTIQLNSYTEIFGMLVVASGIVFQLPVAVYLLSRMGLVTPDMMREYRKHAYVFILILGAVITPPDVISQILISLPIWFLYEISIFVSASVQRGKAVPEHL